MRRDIAYELAEVLFSVPAQFTQRPRDHCGQRRIATDFDRYARRIVTARQSHQRKKRQTHCNVRLGLFVAHRQYPVRINCEVQQNRGDLDTHGAPGERDQPLTQPRLSIQQMIEQPCSGHADRGRKATQGMHGSQ